MATGISLKEGAHESTDFEYLCDDTGTRDIAMEEGHFAKDCGFVKRKHLRGMSKQNPNRPRETFNHVCAGRLR